MRKVFLCTFSRIQLIANETTEPGGSGDFFPLSNKHCDFLSVANMCMRVHMRVYVCVCVFFCFFFHAHAAGAACLVWRSICGDFGLLEPWIELRIF